jgi:hypothetical protein
MAGVGQDKKKARKATAGGPSSAPVDLREGIPETEEALKGIERALKKKPQGRWEVCCGIRRWVED